LLVSTQFRILPGLPPYGSPAQSFPETWGRTGQEGLVVEFILDDGTKWVGNFCRGYSNRDFVRLHPNKDHVLVFATGELWIVDPSHRSAEVLGPVIDDLWELSDSGDVILSCQGLAFIRLGATGIVWHTRRLSWDGFDGIRLSTDVLEGNAWSPVDDDWYPFKVDLSTGMSTGGSFSDGDPEGWERLVT
jgi:hypothetical protein